MTLLISRGSRTPYIGGTKVGALFGEAVVFTKDNMPKHFTTRIKQHGVNGEGWLMACTDTLFTDGLYARIARNADEMADPREPCAPRATGWCTRTRPTRFCGSDHATIDRLERESVWASWSGMTIIL